MPISRHNFLSIGALLAVSSLVGSPEALGHEGHDDAPAPVPVTAAGKSFSASSENFEMVVRSAATPSVGNQVLTLYLADFTTNAPIEGATIDLEVAGPGTASATVAQTSEKGVYQATLLLDAPGDYQMTASIEGNEISDLLSIDGFAVQLALSAKKDFPWPVLSVVFLALLAFAALIAFRRRKRFRAAVLITGIVLPLSAVPAAWGHSGHGDEEPAGAVVLPAGASFALSKESQFLLGILTQPASRRRVPQRLALLGRIVPPVDRIANLHSPQPGRISSVHVISLGAKVRKGQVLAEVEQTLSAGEQIQLAGEHLKLDTERSRLDATINQAKRDVAKAKADLSRAERLRDVVAGKTILDARFTFEKAEDALAGLLTQRELFARMAPPSIQAVRTFPIKAPFEGVVTETHATFGEQVDPTKLLYQVVDPRTFWFEADVFERDISKLVKVKHGNVTIDAVPGATFPGRLLDVGNLLDEQTRTLKARFEVSNPARRLKGGMFGRINVDVGGTLEVVSIPAASVAEVGGKRVAFVHSAPEIFEIRIIQAGDAEDGWVPVSGGIQQGDRVVVRGVYQVKSAAEQGIPRK